MGRGFMLRAANPKALLFFTALLPSSSSIPRWGPIQILILGLSSMWRRSSSSLAGCGLFASRAFHLAQQPRFARATRTQAASFADRGEARGWRWLGIRKRRTGNGEPGTGP